MINLSLEVMGLALTGKLFPLHVIVGLVVSLADIKKEYVMMNFLIRILVDLIRNHI